MPGRSSARGRRRRSGTTTRSARSTWGAADRVCQQRGGRQPAAGCRPGVVGVREGGQDHQPVLPHGGRGGDRRGPGGQQRRQDHSHPDHHRFAAGMGRHRRARRHRRLRRDSRTDHPAGGRGRPRGPADLRQPHRRGEPAVAGPFKRTPVQAGRVEEDGPGTPPAAVGRHLRGHARPVAAPDLVRAGPVGRPAADAGDRPSPDGGAEAPDPGRAVARAVPAVHRARRRPAAVHQRPLPDGHLDGGATGLDRQRGVVEGVRDGRRPVGGRPAEGHLERAGPLERLSRRAGRRQGGGGVTEAIQVVVGGVALGAVYFLLGAGVSLVFGQGRIVNFAHGQFLVIAGFTAWAVARSGVPLLVSLLVGVVVVGILAYILERFLLRRVINNPFTAFLISLGIFLILEQAVVSIWGPAPEQLSSPVSGSWSIGDVTIPKTTPVLIGAAAIIGVVLAVIIRRSRMGRMIRASAEDAYASQYSGINVSLVRSVAFVGGSAVAGLAGVLLALEYPINPSAGETYLITGFVVALMGGLGSLGGAAVGGLVLALAETVGQAYGAGQWVSGIGVALLVLVLIVRPEGLFTKFTGA